MSRNEQCTMGAIVLAEAKEKEKKRIEAENKRRWEKEMELKEKELNLKQYSRGMGAIGLPGDLTSQSRFVRVAFTKMNSISGEGEKESVSQFFHILNSVDQQRGCCELEDGKYEITIYTSCCNTNKGIYYYTTYDNHQITAIDMYKENLDGNKIIKYSLIKDEQIKMQN